MRTRRPIRRRRSRGSVAPQTYGYSSLPPFSARFPAAMMPSGEAPRICRRINTLRGRANRSWSAGRTAFPTVAGPGFSDEPTHDDDRVREGGPEVDDPPPPLGTPHEFLVGVLPGVGPLH